MIGGKKTNQVKCYNANNIFFSSQFPNDWSQRVFLHKIYPPCMYPLENLNSYINKRILVSITFPPSQFPTQLQLSH